jgi:hypothetical protein
MTGFILISFSPTCFPFNRETMFLTRTVNKPVFLDDNQFTNLLVRIILVLEPKEQVAFEILVIVIVVITVLEMSIPV